MKEPDDVALVDALVAQLSEHFEAVQIMASRPHKGGTRCIKRGCGNWYARQGMAHEFITDEQSRSQANEIAPLINPPTDDFGDRA